MRELCFHLDAAREAAGRVDVGRYDTGRAGRLEGLEPPIRGEIEGGAWTDRNEPGQGARSSADFDRAPAHGASGAGGHGLVYGDCGRSACRGGDDRAERESGARSRDGDGGDGGGGDARVHDARGYRNPRASRLARATSLEAQRVDGIELRGLPRRVDAEDDPHERAEADRHGDDVRLDEHRPVEPGGQPCRRSDTGDDADEPPAIESDSASMRNCVRMWWGSAPTAMRMPISRVRSVTLTSMMFMIPMPPTSSDTAATLASSSVMVCVPCWRASAISLRLRMREVVVVALRDVVAVAQQRRDVLLRARWSVSDEVGRDHDLALQELAEAALHLLRERRVRDERRVVVVLPGGRLALLARARRPPGTACCRRAPSARRGWRWCRRASSTTVWPRTTTLVPPSTSAWVMGDPVAMGQLRMSKYSGEVPVMLVVQFWSSLTTGMLERSDGAAAFTVGTSLRMAVEVVPRERGHRAEAALDAAAARGARQDDEDVGAHRGERLLDLRLGARADGHHGDDGADADDDAERGEERAQLVAQDGAQGDAERVEGVHAAPSRLRGPRPLGCLPRRSDTMRPSLHRARRRDANSATSGSCVTSTTVIPERQSPGRCAMTSTLVRESSAPVGSSARMTLGVVDDGPRDGHALLLPAGELVGVVVEPLAEAHALERLAALACAARARRAPPYTSGSSTFSSALVRESRLNCWKTKPRTWLRIRASSRAAHARHAASPAST